MNKKERPILSNLVNSGTLDIEKIQNRIKKLSVDDILKISSDTFRRENLNIAVIGPVQGREKEIIEEMAERF